MKILYVSEIYANQGPTLKRIRPAAKGSAVRIRKRTSHITILREVKRRKINMGQKMHPHGLRVGVIKDWNSKWYADSKILAII